MERNRTYGRDRDDEDRGSSRRGRDRDDRSERGGRDRDDTPRRGRDSESSRPSFSYRARSVESAKKRAEGGSKDFDTYVSDSVQLFTPNDGPNTIRILPPTWENPEHFGIDIFVHYGVGPDQQSYLCLHKMKGEACPICEERAEARRNGEDEDYIRELEPSRRSLFYLVDRDKEKEGVQAWSAPFSKIDQAIVKVSIDRKTQEVLPIDHPDEGYDVEFDKKGKGISTQYTGVAIARRSSPLGNDKWLQFAQDNPLPDILVYYDYDHIKNAFGGGGGGSHKKHSDDDREDNRGRGSSRNDNEDRGGRSGARGRGRDSEDDEDGGRSGARGRGREEEPESRSRDKEEEYTWDSIHAMSGEELEALIEAKDLGINANKADSDDELADWICEDLGIKKEREKPRREAGSSHAEDDTPRSRLASMRGARER